MRSLHFRFNAKLVTFRTESRSATLAEELNPSSKSPASEASWEVPQVLNFTMVSLALSVSYK